MRGSKKVKDSSIILVHTIYTHTTHIGNGIGSRLSRLLGFVRIARKFLAFREIFMENEKLYVRTMRSSIQKKKSTIRFVRINATRKQRFERMLRPYIRFSFYLRVCV